MFGVNKKTQEMLERMRHQQEGIINSQRLLTERLEAIENKLGIDPTASPSAFKESPQTHIPAKPLREDAGVQVQMKEKPESASDLKVIPERMGREQGNIEFEIGRTWFNRLGAGAVILGLVYFLKYSFDNQWIGPTGRIVLGIMVGLVMLGAGERLKKKYVIYSQGLIGAGSLALYFSVYAAYNFYHLISPAWAFAFLIVVMTNAVFTAVRHDSLTIGILGIIGGYGAPLLISTGTPLPWIFFGYLYILTLGILGVSIYKRWNSFRLISFCFNQLLILVWNLGMYRNEFILPTFIFVVVNFLAYLAIASGYNIKAKSQVNTAETILIFLNATTFFIWSRIFLQSTMMKDYMGFYALVTALAYIYIGRLAYRLNREDKKQVYTLFVVAIKLITVAFYLQLSHEYVGYAWVLEACGIFFLGSLLKNRFLVLVGIIVLVLGNMAIPTWSRSENYIAISWLGEALGLFLMGYKLKIPEIRFCGMAVLILGSITALENASGYQMYLTKVFLLNWPSFALLLAVSISGTIYYLYNRLAMGREKYLKTGVGVWTLSLIFVFLTFENMHFFRLHPYKYFLSPEQLSLSLLWMIYAIVLFSWGLKRNTKGMRYAALGLTSVTMIKAFLMDLARLATLYRIVLFIILGLILLGISFAYQKKQNLFDRGESQ